MSSTIARKLCGEIVEPALEPNSAEIVQEKPSKKLGIQCSSSSKHSGKVTRSLVIEKKKVINKVIPRDCNTSHTIINQFMSKEVLKRKYIDVAMNTLITGPLRCDNDCVTMVRKRDNHCTCKCSQKRNYSRQCVKEIQTLDSKENTFTDKACARLIETATRGTQFLEMLSGGIVAHCSSGPKTKLNGFKSMPSNDKPTFRELPESSLEYKTFDKILGARRWALSKYPARGPDF